MPIDLDPVRRHVVTLTGVRNKKVAKFFAAVNLFLTIHAYYNRLQAWLQKRNTYTVSVSSKERIFVDVQEWVISLLPPTEQRHVKVVSLAKGAGIGLAPVDDDPRPIVYMGHEYAVSQVAPAGFEDSIRDVLAGSDSDDERGGFSSAKRAGSDPKLFFVCHSPEAQKVLIDKLAEMRQAQEVASKRKPIISVLSSWSSHGRPLPTRPIDSVVLREKQKERIIEDMGRFLKAENDYNRLGIPWHRGYLFEGPPGTGKSSLAKALASHFGLDLYYFPLSSAGSDTNLASSVQNVSQHAILLLEDVDVFSAMKSREEKGGSNLTMSGLLNVLDGVMTPHGLITIMTTNDKGVLDPAIYRPGRVDLDEHIGLLVPGQGERMFEVFYGQRPKADLGVEGLTPARLMEVFKFHMGDPKGAEADIFEMVHGGNTEYTKINTDYDPLVDEDFEEDDDSDDEVVKNRFLATINSAIKE